MNFQNPNEIIDSVNGFHFSYTEKGEWICKAITPTPLKKKIAEKPQIKVVEEIETEYLKEFGRMIEGTVKDIAKYLD